MTEEQTSDKKTLEEVRRSIDRRREELRLKYGLMEDSSLLIREDRDRDHFTSKRRSPGKGDVR